MNLEVRLPSGARGHIVASTGDTATIASPESSPPGSTIALTTADVGALEFKVRACRRDGDGYAIEGRFVNLSRVQRAALVP